MCSVCFLISLSILLKTFTNCAWTFGVLTLYSYTLSWLFFQWLFNSFCIIPCLNGHANPTLSSMRLDFSIVTYLSFFSLTSYSFFSITLTSFSFSPLSFIYFQSVIAHSIFHIFYHFMCTSSSILNFFCNFCTVCLIVVFKGDWSVQSKLQVVISHSLPNTFLLCNFLLFSQL